MTIFVVPIVEGQTEERCIKILLSRLWKSVKPAEDASVLAVLKPVTTKRSSLVKPGDSELPKQIQLAANSLRDALWQPAIDTGFILLLIDAEEDCPATLGPLLLKRAKEARADLDIACVLPKRELENWFKVAAASLGGVCGLPTDMAVAGDAEHGSGGDWLTAQKRRLGRNLKYNKPGDAVELAKAMDLALCRANSPSFRKLCRELEARVPPRPAAPAAEVPASTAPGPAAGRRDGDGVRRDPALEDDP